MPKFTICGLGEVEVRARREVFTHVISIWDAGAEDSRPARVHALFPQVRFHAAKFNDVEVEADVAISRETMRDILEFGKSLSSGDSVLVHCLAGVSRSPGVAFALACQCAGPGKETVILQHMLEQAPWIVPNRRVVGFADDLLRRDGRMLAAANVIWTKARARWRS